MVAKTREQGDEPGRGGIHALKGLEHHLEPGGPNSLGPPPLTLVDTVPPQHHHGGNPKRDCRLHGQPFS